MPANKREGKVEGYILWIDGVSQVLGDISKEEAIKRAKNAWVEKPKSKVELAERVAGQGASIIWSNIPEEG